MDDELREFLRERFDAVDRRLERIERALGDGGHHRCACGCSGHCGKCRDGCGCRECCGGCRDRRDVGGRCRRCGCIGCCGRCGRCARCRCRRAGPCGDEGQGGFDASLRAFAEAQAVLAALARVKDDRMGCGLEDARESVRLLSRRLSALERGLCSGGDAFC